MVKNLHPLLREIFDDLNSDSGIIALRVLAIRLENFLINRGAIDARVNYHSLHGWKNGIRCSVAARFKVSYCMPDGKAYIYRGLIDQ
jgi:hypothetical protein